MLGGAGCHGAARSESRSEASDFHLSASPSISIHPELGEPFLELEIAFSNSGASEEAS